MNAGLRSRLAAWWLLLTLPLTVLNGLLVVSACTWRGAAFAALAFAVLGLPVFWLSRSRPRTKLAATALLAGLLLLDVLTSPRVEAFSGQPGLSGLNGGSRWSLFAMLPEVDQLRLGTWPMLLLDGALDRAHAERLRTVLPNAYGPLRLHGSNLGDVLTPTSGQLYVLVPPHAPDERLPLVVFLHGSGGAFVAYQHLLQRWAEAARVVVVSPGFGFGNWQQPGGLEAVERARAWAEQHLPVDQGPPTLVALSNGGRAVTRLVAADAAGRWPRIVALSAVLEPELLDAGWKGRQVLLLHGEDDERIGLRWVTLAEGLLRQAGARVEARLWPGEDHFLWFSKPDEVQRAAVDWLRARPATGAPSHPGLNPEP